MDERKFTISEGANRRSKRWKAITTSWDILLDRLKKPTITNESSSQYQRMSVADKAEIKDVGGFVAGKLNKGRRKKENIAFRSILTLDIDNGDKGVYEAINSKLPGYTYAYYSTHSHMPERPRLRLIIPLAEDVLPDAYEALGRYVAYQIGFSYFDKTTFEPSRLMYWPSCSFDGEYVFKAFGGKLLEPMTTLEEAYIDWRDMSEWYGLNEEDIAFKERVKKQEDPREKQGIIGAFCRAYSVSDAIDTFLSDIYTPGSHGRYTYTGGSSADGLVIYDDTFAYSHHATDPINDGHEYNAYDLVRVHKFGDGKTSESEMKEWCLKDVSVKRELNAELGFSDMDFELEDGDSDDLSWMDSLEYTKQGMLEKSLNNLVLILENDPLLKSIQFNEMRNYPDVKGKLPWPRSEYSIGWRDADDAQLRVYLAKNYAEFPQNTYYTAFDKVIEERRFHPVRDYLNSLPPWDGIKRVDTLFITCLGAEDTPYTRAVTHKTLVAAVARVMQPGCKFDCMLVLNGPQGIGKSTLIAKLAKNWFSDSLRLHDTRDKTAAEKLQTAWIHEIGEMAGLGKVDSSTLKSFLSASCDDYRPAYGRQVVHRPRQCIFFGTTNAEDGFLRDETGGRRFWPVEVHGESEVVQWSLSDEEVDQIWAETMVYYREEGADHLYLEDDVRKAAHEKQRMALESDPREGMVADYLNTRVPENWDSMSKQDRENFLGGLTVCEDEPLVPIERVTYDMIWRECFKKNEANLTNKERAEIKRILDKLGWVKYEGRGNFYGTKTRCSYFVRRY